MPSNRVVTYIDMNLNSLEQYWDGLVVPNVRAFQTMPSPPSLFNAAHSVWHLHDWVWHDRNPGKDGAGEEFRSYRGDLLNACPELGWLRDIADAGKHRGLGRLPEVQGAHPQILGTPIGLLLALTREVTRFFLVLNDGSQQDADHVLRSAVEFWRAELNDRNLPSP